MRICQYTEETTDSSIFLSERMAGVSIGRLACWPKKVCGQLMKGCCYYKPCISNECFFPINGQSLAQVASMLSNVQLNCSTNLLHLG